MQTKREYLIALGLAKEGRGKFSNAGKEALVKAEAEGIQFLDTAAPVKPAKPAAEKVEKAAKPVSHAASDYLSPSDYRFPETEYRLLDADGKPYKGAGMRNVCDVCRVSFVNHLCDAPALFGAPVRIGKK